MDILGEYRFVRDILIDLKRYDGHNEKALSQLIELLNYRIRCCEDVED